MAVPGQVTNPDLLHTAAVHIPTGADKMPAYLARPKAPGARGGIVVIHEAFGLVEHIRDMARRLANVGYIAVAPDLYFRQGGPDTSDLSTVLPKMFGLPDAQAVGDLEAAAAFLRAQPGANAKVGAIGFCSGGRHSLLFACSSPRVDAAIDCWGGFINQATRTEQTTPERPTPVIDLVPNLRCPVLAVIGAEDQNPSPEVGEQLGARGAAAGKDLTVRVFENAGHAFLADYRPTYREGPAFQLWPEIVGFFAEHLR